MPVFNKLADGSMVERQQPTSGFRATPQGDKLPYEKPVAQYDAEGRPLNWRRMSPVDQMIWNRARTQAIANRNAAAKQPIDRPSNWREMSSIAKATWNLQHARG